MPELSKKNLFFPLLLRSLASEALPSPPREYDETVVVEMPRELEIIRVADGENDGVRN
ncbi:MAG: hypothetical protein LBV44_10270 [Methylobacillus sp.]|jgi:hypothetical protein|nr:hypothetical protein [Methylobacillus sp.]